MTIVKHTLDPQNPPAWTNKEQSQFDAVQDTEIDYSDIPELDEGFFKQAMRASEFKKQKTRVTMRLDADVVEWLKEQGKGYQTRANLILRAAMDHQTSS